MNIDRHRDKLLRLTEVRSRTGLARSTIYSHMKAGTFPPQLQISQGLVAWYESDIDAWIANPMGWRQSA
ncbi:AlpA family transcriptional regulator [Novosphingobium sp. AP12]|uniref:helix-turn-helix transcriptional regulator n=1 Tax=Novosphingobium sp. AP12 TaxID=1144305 RepID=UPI00027205D8|nr:AlpA family transcriptional regulator [Novosphingobium sp. AP12]EJL23956.1 putative transcriptional regulator [Novosphingobium sp. AP12]